MKPSIILEQRLYETKMYSRLTAGMDPKTAGYMQKVRENFTLPFIASLNNISTLMEAEMTADQVTQAFGYAEKIATAGGDNRSMLGKGADAAGAVGAGAVDLAKKGASGVKQLADKLLAQNKDKLVQSLPPADAGPVEGFEQKAQEQIAQVQDPKAKQSLMDLVKQAAKNPAVQTMVLAAVGGIATVVAGPAIAGLGLGMAVTGALTGTVVGGLTGAVRGLMQGEGLKGALKQGAMGAGLGAVGGGVAGAVAQGAQAYMQNKNQQLPAADQAQNDAADVKAAGEWAKADPAERARIEQTTGMSPEQLQAKIPDNPIQGRGISRGQELPDGSTVDSLNNNGSVTIKRPDGSTMIADRETAMAMANPGKGQFGGPAPADGGGGVSDQMSQYMAAHKGQTLNDMGEWVDKPTVAQANQSAPGNPEASINANAGQQQVDLNNMVQNKIDTGAIPAPQGATPADTGTSAAPATGFKEVTPQGDVVGQLKDLVGQGYQVQRSQTDPGSIAVFDKDGNPMQTLKVGGFNASRMSAAANGILLRSGHSPVPAINENVDYELTARMWALRNRVGKPYSKIHMTEAAIRRAFEMAASSQLNEGPLDWIKKKAGQAADFVKTKVGNVTNKITADKLQQAWTKAGSPTDSVEVGKIMAANGVPQDSVDQILKNMGVPNAPAAPTQAGAEPDATSTPPAQAQAGADASGATPPAPAQAGEAPTPPTQSTVQPVPQGQQPSYGQGATPQAYGVAPQSPQAQAGTTSTPPGNKEIAQGAITKAQDSSKGDPTKPKTDITGTIQKGAEELQGITGAIKAGQGMGTSGQSLMQPRGGSTPSQIKIKDENGQEHAYKQIGQKWYDKDNKEVPPAIAAMLTQQAKQQAALGKDKNAAPLAGPQGEIPGAKPPVPAKAEPMSIGGQKLDPKDPDSARMIAQVQQAQGGAQQPGATPPDLGKQSDGKPIKPGQKFDTETGKPLAQQPGATPPATAQQAPAALDPRDLNKDGTVDATEKSIARNQAKTGATPPAQTPAATAATPPAATTAPASQSPEDIRKAKQADAATAAQGQMAASTQQAQTASNDVMNRMTKQLGAPPAGGPAQTTPNFGKQMTGYGKTTTNAPAGVPAVAKPAVPATTNATTQPAQPAQPEPQGTTLDLDQYKKDQAAKKAQQTAPATPGFMQTKLNGGGVKQLQTAGIDFSAVLLRKMKQRV